MNWWMSSISADKIFGGEKTRQQLKCNIIGYLAESVYWIRYYRTKVKSDRMRRVSIYFLQSGQQTHMTSSFVFNVCARFKTDISHLISIHAARQNFNFFNLEPIVNIYTLTVVAIQSYQLLQGMLCKWPLHLNSPGLQYSYIQIVPNG